MEVVTVTRLGARGEGVAQAQGGRVFVPYALPGESVRAQVEGERARLIEIMKPSADRIAPFCPYYGSCGGCAVQALAQEPYRRWKRELVVEALRRAGIEAQVEPLVEPLMDAHGEGRRRAVFHARFGEEGRRGLRVGFMQARAHTLVEIESCPILAPGMAGALAAVRAIAAALASARKPLDMLVTSTLTGLDVDVRGCGSLRSALARKLVETAERLDLARLSNHGDILAQARAPQLRIGASLVEPPSGAFLQATQAGELALAKLVLEGVAGAGEVADLFAGIGTFALRIAAKAGVHAVDLEAGPLEALARAGGTTPGMAPITVEARDLFRRPLCGGELERFEAVVFDPPRAGAHGQAAALAASTIPRLVAVSCSPTSFARDAALLMAGGYRLERLVPIDQFRHSAHVELVAWFSKKRIARRRRPLLG